METNLSQGIIISGQTMAHPIGIAALLICAFIILFSKRENVILAILIFIFAIPSAQRIVILSLDFSFLRIVILIGLSRAFFEGGLKSVRIVNADVIVLLWMLWGIVAYGILNGNIGAVITRTGFMIEAVGSYFIGRIYIRSWIDVRRAVIFIGYASIPVLVFILIERTTGKNMFSVFGGIEATTLVREGKLRCQGPFSHPIMAGLFWASILPWLAVIWVRNELSKSLLLIIASAVTLIIINTASSTPTMAILLCIVGLYFYKYSRFLPLVNWIAIITLIAAQILMEKGAAHLLARVNIVAGSTGWHRYYLIDQSIKHVNEWWLVGTRTTEHWGLGLIDVTNQYILEGVRGGLIGMVLFIWLLFSIFGLLGKAMTNSDTKEDRFIYWGAGVIMFMHLFSFLSASYFGQLISSFFLFSGVIVSIATQDNIQKKDASQP